MSSPTPTPSGSRIPADLNRFGRESGMLLATVDSLSEAEMAAPSRCEGWTRGHVVTHVARAADGLVRLIEWARTGTEQAMYPGDRDQEIEKGAARPYQEIKTDLADSLARFADAAPALGGDLAVEEVAVRDRAVPARLLVSLLIAEVIAHHDDLDTLWSLEEADPDAQLDGLEQAMRRLEAKGVTPGVTIRTLEKDEFELGGGGAVVTGDRASVLGWLLRGRTDGVRSEGDLPSLPAYG